MLGSSDMDMRSFGLDYGISPFGHGDGFVRPIDDLADVYRSRCRVLTLDEWDDPSAFLRYVDNACRLTSAFQ
ncbi:cardiolipin synthetase [Mobilicoccus pelagius]|uniref:Cardiolipin synthetase n=1 Tax=Mobilicoccus pelagius NBRC 104925 TaxID=1089455 RepID=H5US85_9MICO|nr:cardiolipin synthetase [Mobilicoccus pelagius]GAB48593.1 cardiolipin synthetase [Mobilicoccus pelagius NBRC 104925]